MRDNTDSISLVEMFKIIKHRMKCIILFTIFCTTVVVLFFIFIPEKWSSQATIIIMPSKAIALLSKEREFLTSTSEMLQIPIHIHVQLLKSSKVLGKVIERLNLRENDRLIELESFKSKLKVLKPRETALTVKNLLSLEVSWRDKALAPMIANVWADEYIRFSQDLIKGEIQGAGYSISEQFNSLRSRLEETEKQYLEYIAFSKPDMLKAELDLKREKAIEYSRELLDVSVAIKTKKEMLAELEKQLAMQEKYIILAKAISNDALWLREINSEKNSTENIADRRLKSEEINPVYIGLLTRLTDTRVELRSFHARLDYLNEMHSEVTKQIDFLSEKLSKIQQHAAQLEREVQLAKNAYQAIANKIEDAKLAASIQLGEVRLVSPAVTSKQSGIFGEKSGIRLLAIILSTTIGSFLLGVLGACIENFIKNIESDTNASLQST